MSEVSRRKLFAGFAAAPFLGALATFGDETPAAPAPAHKFAPSISGREMMRRRYFPNFELVSQNGKKMKFYDDMLKDKIVLINFMYADCQGVCPTITANLKHVQKILHEQINHEIFFYSITIKPEVDTPDKLKEYAQMHRITDNYWNFMTGKPEEVDMIRHSLGFADPETQIGYGYIPNRKSVVIGGDPRDVALRRALYSAMTAAQSHKQ